MSESYWAVCCHKLDNSWLQFWLSFPYYAGSLEALQESQSFAPKLCAWHAPSVRAPHINASNTFVWAMTRPLNPTDDEMKCGSSRRSPELQTASAEWGIDELPSDMHLHILTESLMSYFGNGLGCLILNSSSTKSATLSWWVGGVHSHRPTSSAVILNWCWS